MEDTKALRLAARNFIENEIGIITDGKGSRWEVDLEDFEKVRNVFWLNNGSGYARHPKVGYLHRIISPKEWSVVDHIDRNTFNCRSSNLRDGGNSINALNKVQRRSVSLYRGVERNHNRWAARLKINGKREYVGTFDTQEQAAIALENFAAARGFGEFYKSAA